jgi:hypothetical protein
MCCWTKLLQVEDAYPAFTHFITWDSENEPESLRLEVHPDAMLKGETLVDAFAETLIKARSAVEQRSVKARRLALLRVGFRLD